MPDVPEDAGQAIARLQAELRTARLRFFAETLAFLGQPCRQVLLQYRLDEITALPWLTTIIVVPPEPGREPADIDVVAARTLLDRIHDLPLLDELLWLLHEDYDPELDVAHGLLTHLLPSVLPTSPHSGAASQ